MNYYQKLFFHKLGDSQTQDRLVYERPDEKIEYRAGTFILASGHIWSTHLLLLSACSRFPHGLANSTDQVGRYMNGHAIYAAMVEFESDEVFPGMNN